MYIEVIPGIFEKDFPTIIQKVNRVKGLVSWIQIDIADGKLVPNTSFLDPKPFHELIRTSGMNFELHMMVENPFEVADEWASVGFRRIIAHIEALGNIKYQESNIKNTIHRLKRQGVEVGLAIDKNTPVETLFPYSETVDCVLVMTIAAGFSGQRFVPQLVEKVKVLKARRQDLPIEVDGGIQENTAKQAIQAGANRLVSTSYIFGSSDIGKAIERLKGLPTYSSHEYPRT